MPTDGKNIAANFVKKAYYKQVRRGYLGEPLGGGRYRFESARPNRVRVRIVDNNTITGIVDAINNGVALNPNVKILLDKNEKGEWEVIGVDPEYLDVYNSAPNLAIPPHTHAIGSGLEYPIESARLEMGLIRIDGSLIVEVNPFWYVNASGTHKYFGGGTINLASYRPASGWCWVKIGLTLSNSLTAKTGSSETAASLLGADDLASIDLGRSVIPLFGVKLQANTGSINDWGLVQDCRNFVGYGGGQLTHVTACGHIVTVDGDVVYI